MNVASFLFQAQAGFWDTLFLTLPLDLGRVGDELTSSWRRSRSQSRNSRASCWEFPRNCAPYLDTVIWTRNKIKDTQIVVVRLSINIDNTKSWTWHETVLLCHHWIRPLHINNCLVQLSYHIWPQKTTDGSPDCWANNWYNPPHSPVTILIQSEQKGWKNNSGPAHPAHFLFELLPSGQSYRALSTRTTRHRNRFFPQAIHEHLTLNVEHTTLLYHHLFTTHTYFFISN